MLRFADIVDWGRLSYPEAWQRQQEFVEKRALGEIPDTLVLCESDPVYTFGRGLKGEIPEFLPFPSYLIERGGCGTYHGPGQLVIYPICKLSEPNVTGFLRSIEAWIIDLIGHFGLTGERREKATGVWVNGRKIASIGIAIRKWVTYHGAALNVNPDMSHFAYIEPCGFTPAVMTSMQRETGKSVSLEEVKKVLCQGIDFPVVEVRVCGQAR